MGISDRIREISRSRYGGNVSEMARSTGIPIKTLYKYIAEDNPISPGADALQKLAEIGISVNWLLTGEGSAQYGSSDGINTQRLRDLTAHALTLLREIEHELTPRDAMILADRLGRQILQKAGEQIPPIDEQTGLTEARKK